ncbi:MAG: peptide-methionine (S)-S-oxide reductase MsrA [Candidatus Kerfeldbacteria bacterium]|nr:peptide-methionine (S)-S-oxide reductase MsrA [Candidatus Kerfeldbacteria bacterium]
MLNKKMDNTRSVNGGNNAVATLANGCFWCTEAIFKDLKGVSKVTSGYTGGQVRNPTYEQVCTGETGHAEALQIEFDPAVISYEQLLEVFFATHDPTTRNRQGNDVGPQYRSGIFYHDDEQRHAAEKVMSEVDAAKIYDQPIITEINKFEIFYPAESYHQNYYANHPERGYCQMVITPKVSKFRQKFAGLLKS